MLCSSTGGLRAASVPGDGCYLAAPLPSLPSPPDPKAHAPSSTFCSGGREETALEQLKANPLFQAVAALRGKSPVDILLLEMQILNLNGKGLSSPLPGEQCYGTDLQS